MSYIQGFLVPVPELKKEAYRKLAADTGKIFMDYGALRIVEAWGEDVPDGKVTDFKLAVKAEEGERVVFAWIEWPDKSTCDAAAGKMEADERMKMPADLPFDSKRMIYGGFSPIFETDG